MLEQRNPQTTDLPTIIGAPDTTAGNGNTVFVSAAKTESAYTTATLTYIDTYTSAGGTQIITTLRTATITDQAEYASLTSAAAQHPTLSVTSSASATSSSASTTSTSSSKTSSNTNILIPAIAAPVGAIFILSFGFFWWWMRRRAKQEIAKQPDFVMEKRNEKPLKRDDSTHSSSSTRKLVTKIEETSFAKKPSLQIKEIDRTSFDLFPTNGGRSPPVMAPSIQTPSHSRQISTESSDPSGPPMIPPVAVRNFSRGPSRPGTATKENDPGSPTFFHTRGMSSPTAKGFAPGNPSMRSPLSPSSSPYGNRPEPRGPSNPFQNPPPSFNSRNSPSPRNTSSPGPRNASSPAPRSGPAPPPSSMKPNVGPRHQQPKPRELQTQLGPSQPEPKPVSALNPPTPTGAYNGSSPISQYSPIIKDAPQFDLALAAPLPSTGSRSENTTSTRKPPPSAIRVDRSPMTPQTPDFSEENMRIARLADSSRLGFHPVNSPTNVVAPVNVRNTSSTIEPPTPSPRLPPPATRDAPPSNMNIPLPPPPVESTLPTSKSHRTSSFAHDRQSAISRLSSDDGYVDMEIDNKSDVSSLDERERWQMEQDSRSASRQAGLGGYGGLGRLQPPRPVGNESEASGSQYSLGRY